jgi:hypothetical protein
MLIDMKRIYICGNKDVDIDNMPFRILAELRGLFPEIDFIEFDPTENLPADNPLMIIDTVLGVDKVVVVKEPGQLGDSPHVSVHDADLAFHLKWLAKLGKLPKIVIFGVPAEGEKKVVLDLLAEKIRAWI